MNKVAIINCSPRQKNSVSSYFINEFKNICKDEVQFEELYLSNFKQNPLLLNDLTDFKKIILASPLYVDALPSEMVSFMEEFEKYVKTNKKQNIKIYSIINCGFIEGTQNVHALEMLKIFTKKSNLTWGFGVGIGGGEFMKASQSMPLHFFVKKPVYNALLQLKSSLLEESVHQLDYLLVNAKIPQKIFIAMGDGFWNSKGKTFNLSKKDLLKKHISY